MITLSEIDAYNIIANFLSDTFDEDTMSDTELEETARKLARKLVDGSPSLEDDS